MKSSLAWLPMASGMIVLVLSLGLAFLTVTNRNSSSSPVASNMGNNQALQTQATNQVPTLSLSPANGDFAFTPGSSYPVGIVLDAAGEDVDGFDAVISFDPAKVQVLNTQVSSSNLFPQVLLNRICNKIGDVYNSKGDKCQEAGKIRFSAGTFNHGPITGIVGTFSFKPLITGEAMFTFDFTPGVTTDSNVAAHGTTVDALGKVGNGDYVFK